MSRIKSLTELERAALRQAMSSGEIVTTTLIRIKGFGCSIEDGNNGLYTSKSACELNGGKWVGDKLITPFDFDITADVIIEGVETIETFESVNYIAEIPEVDEELGTAEIQEFDATFIAINNDWLEIVQTHESINKLVEFWRVFLNPETLSVIAKPIKWFTGHITEPAFLSSDEDEGDYVTLRISNSFYDYERTNGIVCNTNSHQNIDPAFSDDTGFEFCTDEEIELPWMSGVEG